jgi:hypothetical protein
MSKISEKSYVSLGLVAIILSAVVWAYSTFASAKEVGKLKDTYQSVDERLSKMEGTMEGVQKTLDKIENAVSK